MPETIQVDVAVIGAGTAGLNARREVEKRGGRVVMIESGPYGTTCARVGCMPSKLLIAAAAAARGLRGAAAFGVHPGSDWRVDGPAVMRRVQQERDRFVGFAVADTERVPAEQRLRGQARFVGPTTLSVDDARFRVEARTVVVATGSHPFVPPPFSAIRDQVLTSDDVFDLPDLPASMAVVGTGVIALELGQALQSLGVRVTFFHPSRQLGPSTDPEVNRVVQGIFETELDLQLGSEATDAARTDDGIRLRWRSAEGDARSRTFASVLVAAGRRPNLAGLDLEKAGLALDERGIPIADPRTTQWGDAPVFLAGDASHHRAILHEAADEGRIAGANAMLWPRVERHERRVPLAIAFTDPQLAMVGARFVDLPPGRHAVGQVSFDDQGRARVDGRNRGILRVYGELGSCRLLGAELFGPGVEHMAHLLAWAVQQETTVPKALELPFYHPVVEEGLRTALRDLGRSLNALEQCRPEDHARAPGA